MKKFILISAISTILATSAFAEDDGNRSTTTPPAGTSGTYSAVGNGGSASVTNTSTNALTNTNNVASNSTSNSSSNANSTATGGTSLALAAGGHSSSVSSGGNSSVGNVSAVTGPSTSSATGGAGGAGGTATASGGNSSVGNVSSYSGPSNSSASTGSSNSSTHVQIEQNYEAKQNPVTTAYSPGLTSGFDTCLGSVSGGIQTQIFGLSGGGTKVDENCVHIKNAHLIAEFDRRAACEYVLTNVKGAKEAGLRCK